MTVKVKICGITSAEDACRAVESGADAIGLMFYEKSPRHVTLAEAAWISRAVPPFISKVGVFVNSDRETVEEAVQYCGLDALQFHGEETPSFCESFLPRKTIKAFRVKDAATLEVLLEYYGRVDAVLLDSYVAGQRGGTGATFNWDLARRAKEGGVPVVLAGGLTPDNVAKAVRLVGPYGVDVSSGVESAPGRKDGEKVAAFIRAAKAAQG